MLKPVVYPPKTLSAEVGKRTTHRATGYVFEKSANGKWAIVWTKELTASIRKAYVVDGMTLRDIANTLGVSHSSIQKLVEQNGWMRSKKERGKLIKSVLSKHGLLKRLYLKENKSSAELSEMFGIDASYFEKYFKEQPYCRTMSESRKNAISKGRVDTLAPHRKAWEKYLLMNISDFDMVQYNYAVRRFTNVVLLKYAHIIDPKGKRSYDYHIDHRLSVADGYAEICKKKGKPVRRSRLVPLHIICHPANLLLMAGKDNVVKNARSSITLTQLKRAIKDFESEHGEVFNG